MVERIEKVYLFQTVSLISKIPLERKIDAMRAYSGEIREFPHSRSQGAIEALARVMGTIVGLEGAEAFEVIRQVCSICE